VRQAETAMIAGAVFQGTRHEAEEVVEAEEEEAGKEGVHATPGESWQHVTWPHSSCHLLPPHVPCTTMPSCLCCCHYVALRQAARAGGGEE